MQIEEILRLIKPPQKDPISSNSPPHSLRKLKLDYVSVRISLQ